MKRAFVLVALFIAVTAASGVVRAQTNKPALPANLDKYVGKYPDGFLNLPAVKTRLRKLLGTRYASFVTSFAVQMPFQKVGGFLFTTGCQAHSCTLSESAIAVDIAAKTIHVGIYRQATKGKFFNEAGADTPRPIADWADELSAGR